MSSFSKKTLIHIEDRQEIQEIVREYINDLNINIYSCDDCRKALELVESLFKKGVKVDLILADINAGDLKLKDFIEQVQEKIKTLPVLIINSSDDEKILELKNKTEVFGVLGKPFRSEDIIEIVSKALI